MKTTTIVKSNQRGDQQLPPDLFLTCVFSGERILDLPPVQVKGEMIIGRIFVAGLGLKEADETMSRNHFRIRVDEGRVLIKDLESANGTYVNRQELYGTSKLWAGDVIRAGETVFLMVSKPPETGQDDRGFLTRNRNLRELRNRVERIAGSDISVLLLGETGTGKDILAQHLHRLSGREGRFVPVNCSAIPASLLESSLFGHDKGAFTGAERAAAGMFRTAHQGTLFLDEIGEMGLDLQAKLLRSLETRSVIPVGAAQEIPVDVRIVAATSRRRSELESGRLREDLLGRLEDLVVQIPPLRDRREDILFFAAREMKLAPDDAFGNADVAEAMLHYPWPRNVRELIRSVRSALLLHGGEPPLHWESLKEGIRNIGGIPTPMPAAHGSAPRLSPKRAAMPKPVMDPREVPSRETMIALKARCDGNISEIARILGKHRRQVYRWLDRYDLRD